jgi:hypothetical protein
MWQPQWAATIWKIAGSGVSIKLLSVMQLLSVTGFCIGRAVMALLFFIVFATEIPCFSSI